MKTRRGISATEVLCAAVILALGLVPLLTMQTRTTRHAGLTRGHALASLHARALLDRLAARGAEALAREAAAGGVQVPELPAPTGFQLTVSDVGVSDEQPERPGSVVTVHVTLEWSVSTDRALHRVCCTRVVARRDLSWTVATELPSAGGTVAD